MWTPGSLHGCPAPSATTARQAVAHATEHPHPTFEGPDQPALTAFPLRAERHCRILSGAISNEWSFDGRITATSTGELPPCAGKKRHFGNGAVRPRSVFQSGFGQNRLLIPGRLSDSPAAQRGPQHAFLFRQIRRCPDRKLTLIGLIKLPNRAGRIHTLRARSGWRRRAGEWRWPQNWAVRRVRRRGASTATRRQPSRARSWTS